MVIGLEVHVELKTKTKIFCSCSTEFGAEPNTQCCPICLGYPGTLPVLNAKVVDYAIKAGLATNCTIAKFSKQDRKNYFYPDLPKAYQISQYDLPLCIGGWLDIETKNGKKRIRITRIHIEEDAGKLIHRQEGDISETLFDANRCGVSLIEIVSEPDLRSAEEVVAYLKKLRSTLLYTGVSDCKMNEGSMRCDVNLSVRKVGEEAFGTRTEMKNLNSFQFIARAIEYEFRRQVEELESGGKIVQETRRFDEVSGKTFSMRTKEDADDYRYFPDPDLCPIIISDEKIAALRAEIPMLPEERKERYIKSYGLTPYDAEMITAELKFADFFEKTAEKTKYPKLVANMLISEIFSYQLEEDEPIKIGAEHLASIAEMLGSGRINSNTAKKLLSEIWETGADPHKLVKERNLEQISDRDVLLAYVRKAIADNPKSIADYFNGKTSALKAIVGKVMAATGGKANPIIVNELIDIEIKELR
ncbi:MAG: Asp-tRNA(Asn)/Glu-tRNA(Gln) amidotransferase subunit GatB [Clostridiales bacterium]|nr:Asp-tRNA(Asn)/Glu-tRNA(Gln) amidotransferase subunit GatB [Clostridiales bacterium]